MCVRVAFTKSGDQEATEEIDHEGIVSKLQINQI